MSDFALLAAIMEEAAGYYRWRAGRLRLLHVVLNLSYRANPPQPCATLPSHAGLLQVTRFRHACTLSEAITDLVSCRVLQREGHGRGGLVLTPMPDWWNWGVSPVDEQCGDRSFVLSLVGYMVRPAATGGDWDIERLAAVDPQVDFMQRYTVGQLRDVALIPDDPTLPEAVAAIAREEAAKSIEPEEPTPAKRRERPSDQAPLDVDTEEAVDYARSLFPHEQWESYRRDAWIRTVAADQGPRVLYRALMRAKEFGPKRVLKPWVWLGRVMEDLKK